MSAYYFKVENCPVCHSKKRNLYYKGTVQDYANKSFETANYACTTSSYGRYCDLVKCSDCQLIYASIHPSQQALEDVYSKIEDPVYLNEEEGRIKTFNHALKELDRHCPNKGKIFEFGSYTGVFLELARKDGWQIDGVDLSHWAREVALNKRRIALRSSTNVFSPEDKNSFAAIAIWDVIEHLADPGLMISQAADLLKPGGVVALSTIVLDSLSARLLGKRYPFLMEMHLVYFTHKTLIDLFEQNGFEILEYRKHARFVSYGYLLSRFKQLSFLYNNLHLSNFLKSNYIQLSVGLRDVYARKK